jgi:hypothetical protein
MITLQVQIDKAQRYKSSAPTDLDYRCKVMGSDFTGWGVTPMQALMDWISLDTHSKGSLLKKGKEE